jgi:hypothetical protein
MMNSLDEEGGAAVPRARLSALLPLLRRRRVLFSIVAVAILGGLALNWSTLGALGIAPVLIALLPCLAMCGLGLCMNHSGNKGSSCHGRSEPSERQPPEIDPSR